MAQVGEAPAKRTLRDQMLTLRHRERELEEELAATTRRITAELEHNRSEQRRIKHLLVTDVKSRGRLKTSGPRAGRRVLSQLGSFTFGFARGRLGWEDDELKQLIEVMECEKPPSIERAGKYNRQQVYRYVGPPIEEDAEADKAEAEFQDLRTWALSQTTAFTPAQGAAACETARSTALRAFRRLQEAGALIDKGPTQDTPIFSVAGVDVPDFATPPALKVVEDPEPAKPEVYSKIPQVQELLAAAAASGLTVTTTGRHHSVENLEGERVVFETKPPSREAMLALRGRIRRMGAKL